MEKRIIPFSPPDITESEIEEVSKTLRSGWITTGPKTKLLERRIAAYIETGRNDINCEVDGEVKKAGINDYWVITKGNMYHLTGAKDWNIWATYAYIYLPKGSVSQAKDFSFAIDEGNGIEGITTYIDGLFVEAEGNNVEDHDVYTLSGTKVGKGTLDTLPKGIYILNGRKYVKK